MRNFFVVDTNVPIAANGSNENISYECRFKCVEFLEKLADNGCLVVDLEGEVEAEYRRYLKGGQPGVGNRFLRRFFSEAAHRLVRISLRRDRRGNFVAIRFDGSLKNFDQSDRKFAALSKIAKVPVAVAVDSDWVNHDKDLGKSGVTIQYLCGADLRKWFRD